MFKAKVVGTKKKESVQQSESVHFIAHAYSMEIGENLENWTLVNRVEGFSVLFKRGLVQGYFRFPCTVDQGGHQERSAHLPGQLQGSRGAQTLEWLWQPQASVFSKPCIDCWFYILLHSALCCLSLLWADSSGGTSPMLGSP